MSISKTVERVVNNIKRLRLERGLNKTQLGNLAGIDPSQISRYERGDRYINLENIEKMAQVLEVDIHELFMERPVEEMTMRDKLIQLETLHPLKKELIETMINAFIREQELEKQKS